MKGGADFNFIVDFDLAIANTHFTKKNNHVTFKSRSNRIQNRLPNCTKVITWSPKRCLGILGEEGVIQIRELNVIQKFKRKKRYYSKNDREEDNQKTQKGLN